MEQRTELSDNTASANEWLAFAQTDFGVAEHLYNTYYPKPLEIICYHCQQCAEKSVKAIIALHGNQGGLPKRHEEFLELASEQITSISSCCGTDNNNRPTKTNTKNDAGIKTYTKGEGETVKTILLFIQNEPMITLDELAQKTGLSKSGVRYVLNKLRDKGIVYREGGRKTGRWIIQTATNSDRWDVHM